MDNFESSFIRFIEDYIVITALEPYFMDPIYFLSNNISFLWCPIKRQYGNFCKGRYNGRFQERGQLWNFIHLNFGLIKFLGTVKLQSQRVFPQSKFRARANTKLHGADLVILSVAGEIVSTVGREAASV